METGNNTLPSFSENTDLCKGNHVVINLRYDGIMLLIADATRKKVLQVLEKDWVSSPDPVYLMEAVSDFLEENQLQLDKAESLQWYFSLAPFCLIPDILYQKDKGADLLQYTGRLHEDDLIFADFWSRNDVVSVYALNPILVEWIQNHFEKSVFAHSGFSINALYNTLFFGKDFLFLQVSGGCAEFFIAREGQLTFFNQFSYDVPEDLVYLILFTLEQNQIIAPDSELFISGKHLRESKLFKLLSTYIGEVKEIGIPPGTISERHLSTVQLKRAAKLIATL